MTTEDEVKESVSSIYAQLLDKRKQQKEEKQEKHRQEKLAEQEKYKNPDGSFMTKEQKMQANLDAWKSIVVGLTDDDLEYKKPKNKKKKYAKWIDDDAVVEKKPKKVKKRNYNKEFEPELNMLKTLVAEQNKFNAELQKRFQNAAGPATKDAMMPNKTLVDLASAVNSGRANSLGLLREIGSIKKSVADLVLKQRKLDYDLAGSTNTDTSDMGLMGSNIASSLFTNIPPVAPVPPIEHPVSETAVKAEPTPVVQAEVFDPDSWEGPKLENDYTLYENIPKEVVVERNRNTGDMRFACINTQTGEEINGYDLPNLDLNKLPFNETDMTVKGPLDEIYKVNLVG